MPVLVGTSGWQYRDWRGVLYPPGVPQRSWLEYYAGQYHTVENNGSFYRLPGEQTFADWRARTPEGFVMAVKASRYLTHIRRLRDPAEPVGRLMRAAAGLGDRLGPMLLQLPPNLPADPAAPDEAAGRFARPAAGSGWRWSARTRRGGPRRSVTCWPPPGRAVLGRPARPPGHPALAHGQLGLPAAARGAARPWPRYGQQALRRWVERISRAWPGDADVFVYLNNDPGGAAVRDAAAFASICRRAGRPVTPVAVPGGDG